MRNKETVQGSLTALAQKPGVASGLRLLQSWIESSMAYRGLPGLSVGIVYDQDLIWARGFGCADLETGRPAAPDTLYRIASISKLFTSTAVLQLRDAGKLGLDDPLEKHLPSFEIGGRDPGSLPITLRHLLTHTSGLPREAAFPYWTDLQFPKREEIAAALPGQETVRAPAIKWKYSNLAMALLGEVVARVSGQPYAEYLQEHILDPLGMTSTSVEVPGDRRSRLATGYGRRMPDGSRKVQPFSDTRGMAAAAGLTSSVEDLARFASLQFGDGPAGGRQILAGTTLQEMHRVHWISPDWSGGWGLGFGIAHRRERDLVGHGGWVSGYQTTISTSPKEKIAVIAMFNADDDLPYVGAPESVVDRAWKWVAPPILEAVKPKPEKPRLAAGWKKYLGKYRNAWGDAEVLLLNGQLTLIDPTEQDPAGSQVTLEPADNQTFRTRSDAPFIEDGDPVIFELDSRGRVVRLKVGENYSYPVRDLRDPDPGR